MSQLIGDATIRHMAKQLAGQFYDQKRSGRFRSMDSLTRVKYLHKDPDTKQVSERVAVIPFRVAYPDAHSFAIAHWPLFVDAARTCMSAMLGMSSTAEHDKVYIYEALCEDKIKRERHPTRGDLLQQRRVEAHDPARELLWPIS